MWLFPRKSSDSRDDTDKILPYSGEKMTFIYLMYTYEWYYVPGSPLNPECILAMLRLRVT